VVRGGSWSDGSHGGVFTLSLYYAPSDSGSLIGFRCSR